MVTVCKKWRVSYTEARKLVNDYDKEDVTFPRYSFSKHSINNFLVGHYHRYAAIGPASNLCEALGDRNSAIHQGDDVFVLLSMNHYSHVAKWNTVFQIIVLMSQILSC